jgi:hypothetical protein
MMSLKDILGGLAMSFLLCLVFAEVNPKGWPEWAVLLEVVACMVVIGSARNGAEEAKRKEEAERAAKLELEKHAMTLKANPNAAFDSVRGDLESMTELVESNARLRKLLAQVNGGNHEESAAHP